MANVIREALNADGMDVVLPCANMSRVGFGVSGTWVGTVKFFFSQDGVNFAGFPLSVQPFASGTAVQSTTSNGNFWANAQNYQAVKATFTRTSGTAIVSIAASNDATYQQAFLASTSVYVTQEVSAGATNVITQAAQANRAWRLRTLSVGFSVAAAAAVKLTVSDGASSLLWEGFVPASAGAPSAGGTWLAPLPLDELEAGVSNGGLVGTPGNSMVVTLAAPGGAVVSSLNCEFLPA